MRERRSRAGRGALALAGAALLGASACKGAVEEDRAPRQEVQSAAVADTGSAASINVEPVLVLDEPTSENREAMRLLVVESLGWDPEVRDSLATLRRRSREMTVEEKRQAEAAFRSWLLRWKEQNPERAKAAAEIGGEPVEVGSGG